jgi:ketosteroid isomerase-like protein
MSDTQILELGRRWADAERRADAGALDTLVTDDFLAVGPLGFVLDRRQWLDRYRSGALRLDGFAWEDVGIRDYGGSAVAVGTVTQQATYQGEHRPEASGRFRVTQIAVEQDGRWRFAGIQFSGPMPDVPPRQG